MLRFFEWSIIRVVLTYLSISLTSCMHPFLQFHVWILLQFSRLHSSSAISCLNSILPFGVCMLFCVFMFAFYFVFSCLRSVLCFQVSIHFCVFIFCLLCVFKFASIMCFQVFILFCVFKFQSISAFSCFQVSIPLCVFEFAFCFVFSSLHSVLCFQVSIQFGLFSEDHHVFAKKQNGKFMWFCSSILLYWLHIDIWWRRVHNSPILKNPRNFNQLVILQNGLWCFCAKISRLRLEEWFFWIFRWLSQKTLSKLEITKEMIKSIAVTLLPSRKKVYFSICWLGLLLICLLWNDNFSVFAVPGKSGTFFGGKNQMQQFYPESRWIIDTHWIQSQISTIWLGIIILCQNVKTSIMHVHTFDALLEIIHFYGNEKIEILVLMILLYVLCARQKIVVCPFPVGSAV